MLSLSSYHTAIVQTGAAMFSFAAPVGGGYANAPVIELPVVPIVAELSLRAMNDNINGRISVAGAASSIGEDRRGQYLDHAHNEALFNALLASSSEVSGPIFVD